MNRRIALLTLTAGLCVTLGGCVLATTEQVTTIPVPHVAGSALSVTAHNGAISVRTAADAQVQIVATLRMISDARLAGTTITANRDATGTLVIAASPAGGSWYNNEGCGFEITLPDVQGVTLKSSNGRIELTGASGPAVARSSNGSIVITNHNGSIDADTSNGRIEIVGVAGPVKADTSNGAVKVSLQPSNPGPVDIETSNGAVTLELAKNFVGTVSARTSNGSISTPAASELATSMAVERSSKRNLTLRIGSGGTDSSIRTSNGSVRIQTTN